MKRRIEGRPVYSTDPAFVPSCKTCGEPPRQCRCQPLPSPPPGEQVVRIRREKKGRRGKTVTVIEGFQGRKEDLREISRWLKEACGTGGTVKGETVELQGDHGDRVEAALRKKGYGVRRVGG